MWLQAQSLWLSPRHAISHSRANPARQSCSVESAISHTIVHTAAQRTIEQQFRAGLLLAACIQMHTPVCTPAWRRHKTQSQPDLVTQAPLECGSTAGCVHPAQLTAECPLLAAPHDKAPLALFTHIVCTPDATACEAPVAAHAQCHLPSTCLPCSRDFLKVLEDLPKRAEYCNEECFPPECESTANCKQRGSRQLAQHLR
jgi:hypothetical protein